MSLKIYHGRRVEDLAEKLVEELKAERQKKGPFEALKVAVANPNLGNWLKMKVLAKEPELGASVEMPFLNEVLEGCLTENDPHGGDVVSGRDYPILILNILMKDDRAEFAPFRKYIKEGRDKPGALSIVSQREATRAVQLANVLGQLIDDYESTGYLPTLENFKDSSGIFKGEQALVDAMREVRSQRKLFDSLCDITPKGPSAKILLFGHTLITPLQREIIEWIAKTHEVIWFQPEEKTSVEDGVSLQVVGAPGIRREVEMVHERILNIVWDRNSDGKPIKKDGVNFSDVAVLVTDMPKYRTMIESVFEGHGQIPFGLVDATTQDYSTYLDGFLALMDVARYGLSRKRLFAVLSNPCVQRAMGFSGDDVAKWQELAKRAGAFEGFSEADSDEGNVSGRFNWEWALKRLRLGLVANRIDGVDLEALDADDVSKFSEVIETLHRRLCGLNAVMARCSSEDEKEWPMTWAGRFHAVMDEFLNAGKDDSLESMVRANIVRALNGLVKIEGDQNFRLPVAVVASSVVGVECAKGGYLRHGVTIGGLRSLAHVPFKHVFVVGLQEGAIPEKNNRSTLDVRNELPDEERKDVLRSAKSRAQFMAAVASARKELVLSYPCIDLQSDAKLYPSSLVHDVAKGVKVEHYPLEEPIGNASSAMIAPALDNAPVKETLADPSAKDLAAFVKDPFNGVFGRRFKIAEENWRANSIDDVTPLGVPYGPAKWDLEKAMILQSLDSEYAMAQKLARVPQSYLGEFAHKKIAERQCWADGNATEEDRAWLRGEKGDEAFDLLCRHYKSVVDEGPILIPPAAVLESFYRFLVRHIELGNSGDLKFKIRVIAFDDAIQTWAWNIPAAGAEEHINKVKEWYGKVPPAVTYDGLRENLKSIHRVPAEDDAQDFWGELAQALDLSKSKLAIAKILDRWRRPPTGEELEKMYDEMFKLPMSGTLVVEEEVQNA